MNRPRTASRLAPVAMAVLTLCGTAGAKAASPPAASAARPAAHPAEVSIPDSRRIDFTSSVNGRRYALLVALPQVPPPKAGYRVLYVLDGYDYFASATEAVRGSMNAPDVVVVGIGYPDDDAWLDAVIARHQPLPPWFVGAPKAMTAHSLERLRDLTLPARPAVLAAEATPGASPYRPGEIGGLDGFLQTIEHDVKPRVAALLPVDQTNQALFGHSLGGLAVLHALFTEPGAFRTFVAASPSIWWGDRAVLKDEAAFEAKVSRGEDSPRVLITVGAEEETLNLPPGAFPAADMARLQAMVKRERMIGEARELAGRLHWQCGKPGYVAQDAAVFADLGHGLSPWPALARAIAFAFLPD